MSDDAETCGHPTAGGDGSPCQNPAGENGRCWIPSHNGDAADAVTDAENAPGRPSKFSDEMARTAIQAVPEQKTVRGVEAELGLGEGTIRKWLQKDLTYVDEDGTRRDFFRAFRRARAGVMADLVNGPLYDPPEETPPDYQHMNGQHARYLLASSFGLTKTEKHQHEDVTDGGGGFGTKIVLDSEYADK